MSNEIREFRPDDHAAVVELWRATPGIVVRDADAFSPLTAYLAKNPGLSFVAVDGSVVAGAVLCGTDGRRGYLQHLAVRKAYRGRGLGRALVQQAIGALSSIGIDKCHFMVVGDNGAAVEFWRHLGWQARTDIRLMSHTQSGVTTT